MKISSFSALFSNIRQRKKIDSILLDKNNTPQDLIRHGEDMANAKRYDDALTLFENALRIDPDNDIGWGDKALIQDKQGKTEEALGSFSKALSINPKNAITWHNKGLILLRIRRFRESIECFDMALRLNEKYAKAWYNKGRALEMLGDRNSAQPCLNKARRLDPMLFAKLTKIDSTDRKSNRRLT
jgi:tetratricopeptide (TPR) repeat protein